MEVEVLAIHGWGFDRACWDPLREILPAWVRLRAWDRGYFGNPDAAAWSDPRGGRRVLLAHSMGILRAGDLARDADAVVLVSSFERFHPEGVEGERSRRVLARMRKAMEVDPALVVREFHERCGVPGEGGGRAGDVELLAADLALLDEGTAPVAALRAIPERVVLHGDADAIVPVALGRALADALGDGTTFRAVAGAGHALPFTHPEAVLEALLPVTVP